MDDPQYSVSLDILIYFSSIVTAWRCDVGITPDHSCRIEHKAISSIDACLDAMKHLKVVHGLVPIASPSGQTQPDRALVKERSFMKMAYATAELATCPRLSVGAVIVDPDGYIVASGRNGTPPNQPHCKHPIDEPCTESSHAELNAVIFAGRPLAKGGTMFVTHAPCKPCSGAILSSGLKAVIYDQLYKNTDGIDRLVAAGIDVRKLG